MRLAGTPVKQLPQRALAKVHDRGRAGGGCLGAAFVAVRGSPLGGLGLLLGSLGGLGLLQLLQLRSQKRASDPVSLSICGTQT